MFNPKKGRCKVHYKTDLGELGTHIHSLHAKKQHFTLDDLHQYAKNECDFIGCYKIFLKPRK
jgi:hypothetical protein